ncbi:MAG: hypothetical protein AAF797_15205 [Planctomycetota bacterium]
MPIREALIMVHGVQPSPDPQPHTDDYNDLYNGISKHLPADSPWKTAPIIRVEWGEKHPGHDGPERNHHRLSAAQRYYGQATLDTLRDTDRFSINPARYVIDGLRELVMLGFGDMFYYVSQDGKASLRTELVHQVIDSLIQRDGIPDDEAWSITFVGHSAGSVICADFLFLLFYDHNRIDKFLGDHEDLSPAEYDDFKNKLQTLRDMAEQGRLRVRRLITLGSPFSLVLPRNRKLVERLASKQPLDPAHYGLAQSKADQASSPFEASPLTGPRWINIWDRDDPIAYPIAQLFDAPETVTDLYINVSNSVKNAHGAYWDNDDVHQQLAERW